MLSAHISTREVTALKHEVGDHTMKLRSRIAVPLFAGAESEKVLRGSWDNIVVKIEIDSARLVYKQSIRKQFNEQKIHPSLGTNTQKGGREPVSERLIPFMFLVGRLFASSSGPCQDTSK